MITRRNFLRSAGGILVAAPFVCNARNLMRVVAPTTLFDEFLIPESKLKELAQYNDLRRGKEAVFLKLLNAKLFEETKKRSSFADFFKGNAISTSGLTKTLPPSAHSQF